MCIYDLTAQLEPLYDYIITAMTIQVQYKLNIAISNMHQKEN